MFGLFYKNEVTHKSGVEKRVHVIGSDSCHGYVAVFMLYISGCIHPYTPYTIHETAIMSGFVQQVMSFLLHAATAATMLMAVSLTAVKFKPFTFLCVSCFCTSDCANVCI